MGSGAWNDESRSISLYPDTLKQRKVSSRAEPALSGTNMIFMSSPSTAQIILGCSHDAGSVAILIFSGLNTEVLSCCRLDNPAVACPGRGANADSITNATCGLLIAT